MRRYPEYKESSDPLFGRVPSGWTVTRLKHVATGPVEYGLNISSDRYTDDGVRFLRTTDITDAGTLRDEGVYLDHGDVPQEWLLAEGDLLLSRSGTVGRAYVHPQTDGRFSFAGYLVRFRCSDPVVSRFVFYLTKAAFFAEFLKEESLESTIGNVNGQKYANLRFALPPHEDLPSIVQFLDRKTAQIDTLIHKKQALIDLLREQRTALINRAVTRGLDPDVPMKDSGIEWLGEVPEHWTATQLKYITPQVTVGIVVTPAKYYVDSGIPCLRSLNVREDGLVDADLVYISAETNEELSKSKVYAGDLVAVRTGKPGTTAVVDTRFDGANCIDLLIIRRAPSFDSSFLAYALNSQVSRVQYQTGSGGAIQQHFNVEMAKDLLVALPPLEEQQEIGVWLANKTKQIDTIALREQRLCARLSELRASLISDVVTGKIDVRDSAAASPDEGLAA